MLTVLAAVIVAAALLGAAAAVRDGLLKLSEAFGWTEQTAYVDLDKLIAEKVKEDDFAFNEDDLVLGSELVPQPR